MVWRIHIRNYIISSYNIPMNHHRLGITAIVFLVILSGFYFYSRSIEKDTPPLITAIEIPFDGLVPSEITQGDASKKQIIFTFDGGEGIQSATSTLAILKKHQIKGTFFLTGKWVQNNMWLARMIHNEGHEIFNHTFDHPHLTTLSILDVQKELTDMDNRAIYITGSSTKPYFRPPYGDRDARVLASAANAGYRSVYWTIDAQDWRENEGMTENEVKGRILDNTGPGSIVLMHLGDNITGNILDEVLTTLEKRGYKMVSLTEGL